VSRHYSKQSEKKNAQIGTKLLAWGDKGIVLSTLGCEKASLRQLMHFFEKFLKKGDMNARMQN
jgi:hypothetical protein